MAGIVAQAQQLRIADFGLRIVQNEQASVQELHSYVYCQTFSSQLTTNN
jgi:hypothetical protein